MVSQGSTEDHQRVEIEEFITAGPGGRAIWGGKGRKQAESKAGSVWGTCLY